MRFHPGESAPDFTKEAVGHGPMTLSGLRPQRVWLSFFRDANCPLCIVRKEQLEKVMATLEPGALTLVAVFESPAADVRAWRDVHRPGFLTVADPGRTLYEQYGVATSVRAAVRLQPWVRLIASKRLTRAHLRPRRHGAMTRVPADFLIEGNGVIRDAFYGQDVGDCIPAERVERFVEVTSLSGSGAFIRPSTKFAWA